MWQIIYSKDGSQEAWVYLYRFRCYVAGGYFLFTTSFD